MADYLAGVLGREELLGLAVGLIGDDRGWTISSEKIHLSSSFHSILVVSCADGVTAARLKDGEFTVRGHDRQIAPFYDPQRLRILPDG